MIVFIRFVILSSTDNSIRHDCMYGNWAHIEVKVRLMSGRFYSRFPRMETIMVVQLVNTDTNKKILGSK